MTGFPALRAAVDALEGAGNRAMARRELDELIECERLAVDALRRVADPGATSLRWRASTAGQAGAEKPNARAVAAQALKRIEARR